MKDSTLGPKNLLPVGLDRWPPAAVSLPVPPVAAPDGRARPRAASAASVAAGRRAARGRGLGRQEEDSMLGREISLLVWGGRSSVRFVFLVGRGSSYGFIFFR